jgi:hypothetical protein
MKSVFHVVGGNFALMLFLLLLAGCAGMSADECAIVDWHTIGFEDGARGYTADRVGDHRKACAKHGVAPDFEAYRAGHAEGLRDYCQPSRAFNVGASGARYNGVCSANREAEFLDAYNSGYHLYNLRSRVNSVSTQINAREAELARTREEIRETEAALISRDTLVEERILLLADLKELSARTGQLESEILMLIEDRVHPEHELASYQAVLADSGY